MPSAQDITGQLRLRQLREAAHQRRLAELRAQGRFKEAELLEFTGEDEVIDLTHGGNNGQ